jgi:hypothetical protein
MRRLAAVGLAAFLIPVAFAVPSVAQPDGIDESQLVPTLSQTFAPWTCVLKSSGPVCRGERHLLSDWAPEDIPCDVALYNRRTEDRWQTRYYDHDYLNYDRWFRTNDVDEYSTSPSGPGGVSIRTNVRWTETFAVPGDDSTLTYAASGTHWDVQGPTGASVYRVVGTMTSPYGGDTTFTGHVTQDGVTTRYADAAFDDIFDEDWFLATVCEVAKANA